MMMNTEHKPKKLMDLGLDMDEVAKEEDELMVAATGGSEDSDGGLLLASDENDDMNETGVREHAVDERVDELTESEKFALHAKTAFDKSVALGEELLRNNDLSLRDRAAAIEVMINDLDMMLDKDAIKADSERMIAGRATKTALQRTLEYTLQRVCLEHAQATPSTLPERIQSVSDTDLERMSLGLGELELKAVTDEGKKEAQRLLAIVAGDKTRRASAPRLSVPAPSGEPVDERGPTQAMSVTPVPPKDEARQPVIIPPTPAAPAPISGAWQSGPEAQQSDPNKVVTKDAPVAEPSVVLSPSMEAQVNEAQKNEQPVEPPLPVLRIGRHTSNEHVIDDRTVSGHHAQLTLLSDETIKVDDLQSSNGTFVDEIRVPPVGMQVKVGQVLRFGEVGRLIIKGVDGKIYLEPTDKPTGHTAAFMAKGEKISEAHHAEQLKLDAEAAKLPPPPKVEEKKSLKSPTELEMELRGKKPADEKSSGWRTIGFAALALCLIGCLVGVGVYGGASLLNGLWSDESTVAETETSTETSTEATETSTPTETPEVEVSTPVVAETPSGFSCRPGSSVTSCHRVEDFLLARADGEAYWDCSGMDPDAYRDIYSVEDPTGSRRIVANTCACQLCEPTATP